MQNRNGRTASILRSHVEPVDRLRTFRSHVTLLTLTSTLPTSHLCTGDCQFHFLCAILDTMPSLRVLWCMLRVRRCGTYICIPGPKFPILHFPVPHFQRPRSALLLISLSAFTICSSKSIISFSRPSQHQPLFS